MFRSVYYAIIFDYPELLKRMLHDKKSDSFFTGDLNYQIQDMCMYGRLDMIKLLLNDPRIDPSGHPIITASRFGRLEIVRELLKHPRVDPRFEQNGAFECAAVNGHFKILKMLLESSKISLSERRSIETFLGRRALHNYHTPPDWVTIDMNLPRSSYGRPLKKRKLFGK